MRRELRQVKRMMKWYQARSHRTRIILAALLMLFFLGVIYGGVREAALRNADRLVITITRTAESTDGPAGGVVYHQAFGHALTADAQHLLNDRTDAPSYASLLSFPAYNPQVVPGPQWHYHLAFFWRGILVETADMTDDQSPEVYRLSALGLPDLRTRIPSDPRGTGFSILEQLSKDSGGSIPVPSA